MNLLDYQWVLKDDAEKFVEIVEEINNKVPDTPITTELNKHVIKLFSKTCTGDLCPMQAVIGGIAAQELIKVCRLIAVVFR